MPAEGFDTYNYLHDAKRAIERAEGELVRLSARHTVGDELIEAVQKLADLRQLHWLAVLSLYWTPDIRSCLEKIKDELRQIENAEHDAFDPHGARNG